MTIRKRHYYSEDPVLLAEQVGELARDVAETFDASASARVFKLEAAWVLPFALTVGRARPSAVLIGAVEDLDDPSQAPGPYGMHWSWDNGTVRVNALTGLTAGTTYRITFVVFGGSNG